MNDPVNYVDPSGNSFNKFDLQMKAMTWLTSLIAKPFIETQIEMQLYADDFAREDKLGIALGAFGYAVDAAKVVRSSGIEAGPLLGNTAFNKSAEDVAEVVTKGTSETKLLPAPQGTNPWVDGGKITSMEAPTDLRVNMAMAPGQTRPGGWATLDEIPDVNFVRNRLAVTLEFKPEVSKVQEFLIPKGTRIQVGNVGPQIYKGVKYPGGANQVQILNYIDRAKLIKIGDPRLIE